MRRVLRPKWWLLHLAVVAAVLGMLRLGLWQWHRANSASGGIQNYAYALQWPLFAVFGLVLWVKTMREEVRRGPGDEPTLPARPLDPLIVRQDGVRIGVATTPVVADDDDPEVQAYNARLAALNARAEATEARRR